MTSLFGRSLAIIGGYHADPFRYLGRHDEGDAVACAFLPGAEEVTVVTRPATELARVHQAGLFIGQVHSGERGYSRVRDSAGRSSSWKTLIAFPVLPIDLYLHRRSTW